MDVICFQGPAPAATVWHRDPVSNTLLASEQMADALLFPDMTGAWLSCSQPSLRPDLRLEDWCPIFCPGKPLPISQGLIQMSSLLCVDVIELS